LSLVGTAVEVLAQRSGYAVGATARAIGFGRKALKAVSGLFVKKVARPGLGSKVTSGPLKVGKQVLYGPKPGISTAMKVASAVGASGVGIAAVASHRRSGSQTRPATSPAPRSSRPSPKASSTKGKKCCPAGTKRMVCFKKDVDEVAETKRKAKARAKKARAIKRGRKSARKAARKRKRR
jgi:hypothetical protein